MPIKATCSCGRAYFLADEHAGKRVRCKVCGGAVAVPAAAAVSTSPRPALPDSKRTSPDGGRRPRPARSTAGRPRQLPAELRDRLVAAGTALASNPACSRIDYLQYFLCRPLQILTAVNITLAGVAVAIAVGNPLPVLPALAWAGINGWRQTRGARRVIQMGNVNPGIIIGRRPWRVAIYGDLTTGFEGPRPAVKVMMATSLRWMPNGPPEIGKRISAPSTYMAGPDPCAWTTFYPVVLETLVRDPVEARAVMDSLDQSEWAPLEAWVRRNPDPGYGLYRLWPGAKNVIVKPNFKKRNLTLMWTAHAVIAVLAGIKVADIRSNGAGKGPVPPAPEVRAANPVPVSAGSSAPPSSISSPPAPVARTFVAPPVSYTAPPPTAQPSEAARAAQKRADDAKRDLEKARQDWAEQIKKMNAPRGGQP